MPIKCLVDDCPKVASYAGGVCAEHVLAGRVRRELEQAGLVGEVNTDKCHVDGCTETRQYGPEGAGLCAEHTEQAFAEPACKDRQGPRCKVDGCSMVAEFSDGTVVNAMRPTLCRGHRAHMHVIPAFPYPGCKEPIHEDALCSHPGCKSEATIRLCTEHAGSFIARLERLLKAWAASGPSSSELRLVLETFESELRARVAITEARRGK